MGVEQEDQLHQDRRRVGFLGSKVEHRHDVALIVTAHRKKVIRRGVVTPPLGGGVPEILAPPLSAPS